jgi:hypothetical protein
VFVNKLLNVLSAQGHFLSALSVSNDDTERVCVCVSE